MKNFLIGFIISLFLISNSFAETIVLKCRTHLYKYVKEGDSFKGYQARVKEPDVWWEWPKTKVQEDNKHFLKSIDAVAIVEGYVVTEKFKKVLTNQGLAENGRTIIDFKNKTYDSNATWKGKVWKKKAKCKLQK